MDYKLKYVLRPYTSVKIREDSETVLQIKVCVETVHFC